MDMTEVNRTEAYTELRRIIGLLTHRLQKDIPITGADKMLLASFAAYLSTLDVEMVGESPFKDV